MIPINQYQIEAGICLIVLSLVYLLLFRNETNFTVKRIVITAIPILSMIIPLIEQRITFASEAATAGIQYLNYIPEQLVYIYPETQTITSNETFAPGNIVFLIWAVGSFIMLVRIVVSYFHIWQLYRRSSESGIDNIRLIDDPVQSFSFFNLVMINKSQFDSEARDYVIAHEQAHSKQGHSFDVLFFETIKMLHWINPLIWLLTRESKQNLEYLADQEVAQSTENIQNYQVAIVRHAASSNYHFLKSNFSKSNLKNRIIMMNQPNNPNIKLGKLSVFLPVLALLFMSFSLKIENLDIKKEIMEVVPSLNTKIAVSEPLLTAIQQDSIAKPVEEIFVIVEKMPVPSTGDIESYNRTIQASIKYPDEAINKKIEGKVFVQFVVKKDGSVSDIKVLRGIGAGCDEEAIRAIKEGPTWTPGTQRGIKVNVRYVIPIAFDLSKEEGIKGSVKPVDEGSDETIIQSMANEDEKPLFLVNGKETPESEIKNIAPEEIANIQVLKNNSETSEFGEKGKNGVIMIKLKENTDQMIQNEKSLELVENTKVQIVDESNPDGFKIRTTGKFKFDQQNPPLIIVDGKEIENLSSVDPQEIESIEVRKDSLIAGEKYGEKGKNGVIIIKTKK